MKQSAEKDLALLEEIISYCETINGYLSSHKATFEQFISNQLLQDALIFNLYRIGEAVNNLTPDLKNKHTEIPWQEIVGTRIIIAHVYSDLDYDLTWNTLNKDMEPLISFCKRYLASH